jgi:trigger factor
MKTKVEKIETNRVELEVEISPKVFEDYLQRAYINTRGKINIPGFRKGKAPRKIIETYYGKGVFIEEGVNLAIDETYPKAVKEAEIIPVSHPEVEITSVEPVIYKAKIYIKPEVELGEYIGLEVEKPDYNVTDEDVEKELKKMQEQNGRMIAIEDRPVKEKDTVIIDFAGYVDDVAFEGGTATDYPLTIGSGAFIPGFEVQLIGADKGEEIEVKVTFPEDYRNEELAGKDSVFKVTIKEIKEKELIPLDDEFAKDVSEFDTLEELKADIKNKMLENANKMAEREINNRVVKKVVDNATVEIPSVMIEDEIESLIREFAYRLQYQGMDLAKYMELSGTTEENLKDQFREEAAIRVKTSLVLEKIKEIEKVEATDADIDEEFERVGKQIGKSKDEMKSKYPPEGFQKLKGSLAIEKTVKYLIEKSIIK